MPFLLKAACSFAKMQTHKLWKYHLVTVKPSLAVKMINCMHQICIQEGNWKSQTCATCSTFAKTLVILVAVYLNWSCSYQAWNENQ